MSTNTNIKVSGNIISELSEKIPTIIIALNELVKNSYDAGASRVDIEIDSSKKELIIKDDGCGMNLSDIEALFHISNSTKKYGQINKYGRYTQGSKGLGFLSVFKFGTTVTWKTKKTDGFKFSVDFNELTKSDDISSFPIEILDSDIEKGTEICISLSDYSLSALKSYFENESHKSKILNAFDDKGFTIRLHIDDYDENNSGLISEKGFLSEKQLYTVQYKSSDEKLKFFINGNLAIEKDFPKFDGECNIDIDLIIFHLAAYDKSKISSLFYNNDGDLTPLIYVNSNLFNNFTIFDPNAMRNIKNTYVLAQIIGYIKITSSNTDMNFNSDRTQFLQNQLTDNIKFFLENINKEIQETGAKNKPYILNFDILKKTTLPHTYATATEAIFRENIKDDFSFKDKVDVLVKDNKVIYSLFGKEIFAIIEGKSPPKPASIALKQKSISFPIPSQQINLIDYISQITNSEGIVEANDKATIYINDLLANNSIIESVEESCEYNIRYEYIDAQTGKVVDTLKITFFEPKSNVTAKTTKDKLLTIPAKDDYDITFNNALQKLVLQLNNLNVNFYTEVIACSLRALFDISIDSIRQSSHYSNLYNGISSLEDKVKKTVEYIKHDNQKCSKIANNSGIDYNSLCNRLTPDDFFNAVKKAHLGAHKSTVHLPENDIKEIAHKASLFLIIANEMVKNNI